MKAGQSLIECPDCVILSHQRSGTHFLQDSLASHPQIYGRGEFILQYKKRINNGECVDDSDACRIFRNIPGKTNLGIVMYSQLDLFEANCASLAGVRVLHLLRNPANVAASVARMKLGHQLLGSKFRAHYYVEESAPSVPDPQEADIWEIEARVRRLQDIFQRRLEGRPDVLTVYYEDLTQDRQTQEIPPDVGGRILNFLGLETFPLRTRLKKTGS